MKLYMYKTIPFKSDGFEWKMHDFSEKLITGLRMIGLYYFTTR